VHVQQSASTTARLRAVRDRQPAAARSDRLSGISLAEGTFLTGRTRSPRPTREDLADLGEFLRAGREGDGEPIGRPEREDACSVACKLHPQHIERVNNAQARMVAALLHHGIDHLWQCQHKSAEARDREIRRNQLAVSFDGDEARGSAIRACLKPQQIADINPLRHVATSLAPLLNVADPNLYRRNRHSHPVSCFQNPFRYESKKRSARCRGADYHFPHHREHSMNATTHSEFNMSKESDNKAVVGRWFTEFWGKTCNLEIVDEIAAPDMLLKYSLHEPRRGQDDIKAFMTDFRKAFPDLNFWGTADLIAEGDYVVGQWEGGGTHSGPAFRDFLVGSLPAATGRKMHFTGTTVLKVQNGKILQEIGLDDGVTALTQLGLLKAA
jgi:predicted ester cyclase